MFTSSVLLLLNLLLMELGHYQGDRNPKKLGRTLQGDALTQ
jgi:hypothetical protein